MFFIVYCYQRRFHYEKNKIDNSTAIKDLLEYINDLKQEQSNLQNEHKKLSKNFISVSYRKKGFLDIIFPNRYKKFEKSYIESQRKERNLKDIDENILLLQMEIEENEIFLYRLQHEICEANFSQTNAIEKTIDNSCEEPSIND